MSGEFLSWSYDDHGFDPPPPPPGQELRLGSTFRVEKKLGAGAMGAVFRAIDLASGRAVALKVVHDHANERARGRLQREGELTAALRHPGIVRIHSSGTIDGVTYLAYEEIPRCRTFTDALSAWDREQLLDKLIDICDAVGYAHANGVLHRDLKPSNVLVTETDQVKVADFGLAWAASVERLTQTDAMVGTPIYMPPERVTNECPAGPEGDVWSLGVMLYEALTRELPFQADVLSQLVASICSARPPRPRSLDPSISPPVESVVLKALRRDPGARYRDGKELADALRAARAAPSDPARPFLPWLVGCVALGAIGVGVALVKEPAPPPETTRKPATPPQPTKEEASPARLALRDGDPWRALTLLGEQDPLRERVASALAAEPQQGFVDDDLARWRLLTGTRAAALALRFEDPRLWRSVEGTPEPARALAQTHLSSAARLAKDPALRRDAFLQLAALLPPGEREEPLRRAFAAHEPNALARLLRGELRLAQGRPKEALEELASAGEGQLALWRRGEAHLVLGEHVPACELLTQAFEPAREDPRVAERLAKALREAGRSDAATRVAARLLRLRGSQREASAQVSFTARNFQGVELRKASLEALELDPLNHLAHYYLARSRYVTEPALSIAEAIVATTRRPDLLVNLQRTLCEGQGMHQRQPDYFPDVSGTRIAAQLSGDSLDLRLARGFVWALAVEHQAADAEVRRRAEAELDAVLAARPGEWIAYPLRAFLFLRAGRPERAQHLLDLAKQVFPESGLLSFYEALVLAKGDAETAEIQEALTASYRKGYHVCRASPWSASYYPELEGHAVTLPPPGGR